MAEAENPEKSPNIKTPDIPVKKSVSNIQAAADDKESRRRTELEETHRLRQETSNMEILLTNLKQELQVKCDHYHNDFKSNKEELELMMERMEEQIETVTKAYREEVAQMERDYLKKREILLRRDKAECERHLVEFGAKKMDEIKQRRTKGEEYEQMLEAQMLESFNQENFLNTEHMTKCQDLERETQQADVSRNTMRLKVQMEKLEKEVQKVNLACMKSRINSLENELKQLLVMNPDQGSDLTKEGQYLSKDYKRRVQKYESKQPQLERLAATSVREFEEMWMMKEEEVKHLIEKALAIDAQICRHMNWIWQRPPMQVKDIFATEMLEEVMELLFNETDFLISDNLLNLLESNGDEEADVRLRALLISFGISCEDFPKLVNFVMDFTHQQRQLIEDVTTHNNAGIIDRKYILPALKSFLEMLKKTSIHCLTGRDTAKDKAYWEHLGNMISEDKLTQWDMVMRRMRQHQMVPKNIRELQSEIESLEQENAELRRRLQLHH